MGSSSREKIANRPTSKQKSSSTTLEIFKSNKCRMKKRSEKTRKRVGAEKRQGKGRTTRRINQN